MLNIFFGDVHKPASDIRLITRVSVKYDEIFHE